MRVVNGAAEAIAREMRGAATGGAFVWRVIDVKVARLGDSGQRQTCMTPGQTGTNGLITEGRCVPALVIDPQTEVIGRQIDRSAFGRALQGSHGRFRPGFPATGA